MENVVVNKLDPSLVSAINNAVRHALDEKLHDAEDEIVEKVICRLDHSSDNCVVDEQHGLFNPLGGP